LINENKRLNKKLDEEELDRANTQFKKLDHSDRTARLMTTHLNTSAQQEQDEYVMEYRDGEYVKVYKPFICDFNKCGRRFILSKDMEQHLENHMKKKKKSRSRSDSRSISREKKEVSKAMDFIEKTKNKYLREDDY